MAVWTKAGGRSGARSSYWPWVVTLLAGLLAFVVISMFQVQGQTYVWRDPQSTNKSPFYIGLGSYIGVVLWGGAAVACLLTWAAASPSQRRTPARQGLLAAAALSVFLMFDDLLQIHEIVLPRHLGLSEPATMGIYTAIGIVCLALMYRIIRDSGEISLFLTAVVLLAIEVAVDVVDTTSFEFSGMGIFEDAAKFFGIVFWFAFWFRTCLHTVSPASLPAPDAVAERDR
jgi:hypothetical protein